MDIGLTPQVLGHLLVIERERGGHFLVPDDWQRALAAVGEDPIEFGIWDRHLLRNDYIEARPFPVGQSYRYLTDKGRSAARRV